MIPGVNKRVLKDIQVARETLKKELGIYIAPEENNYYRIHFILPGPEGTPFEGGLYHGMIRLNDNHPYSPPNIHMITPNGRFTVESHPIPATSRGICTTFTSFHPESWTPINDICTILKGFISFMCQPFHADGGAGIGGIQSTDERKRKLAKQSIDHIKSEPVVKVLFPDLYQSLVNGTYKPIKLADLSKNLPIITYTPQNTDNKSQKMAKKEESESLEDLDELSSESNKPVRKKVVIKVSKKRKAVSSSEESREKKVESCSEESSESPKKTRYHKVTRKKPWSSKRTH